LAAFLVFSFHFLHGWTNFPVPRGYTPALFPFSMMLQGHTGVALFMTLSGYLFAKLLDGKRVNYPAFFYNRFLRLFPLLLLVLIVIGVRKYMAGASVSGYIRQIVAGFIVPKLPNGAWSVVIELHFYLLLPVILLLQRKSRWSLPLLLLAAIALRVLLHQRGEIQTLAYHSIFGRIDQFLLGVLAYNYRKSIANRHALVWLSITAFMLFYWYQNWCDGPMTNPPSTSALWIVLPTLEGLVYGLLISYYDNSYQPKNTGLSRIAGYLGAYSYSIYLLHFFVVYQMPGFINRHIMGLGNFYIACLWALLCFLAMLPIGYLSFRFIESPFLKFRRRYVIADPGESIVGTPVSPE
jgi:peptidoglycan/LPS O-acetylase OafA/YrhL